MPTVPTNVLSDARIRSIKPADKPIKAFDGGGLHLYVSPKGAKVWRIAYRLAGKPQTLTIGPYPAVTLAEARARREALHATLRDGGDPRTPRTPKRAVTLSAAYATYWAGRTDVSQDYRTAATRAFEMHIEPLIGARPIAAIERAELLDVLNRMDEAQLYSYVRKTRMWLGMVWEWAVERGDAPVNVPALIRPDRAFGRAPVKHFASVELHEVPDLMRRLALEARLQSVLACLLLAYTWVRTGELRMMAWSELDGDVWRIPAARMKMARDHIVPLPRQAVELLAELWRRSRGSVYVFPADHRNDRAMSENAVLALLARIGYKGTMTGHGWRSIGSTWANEAGYPADAIERQLAHAPDDKVRAAYNRAEFMEPRRAMLQAFADWIDSAAS